MKSLQIGEWIFLLQVASTLSMVGLIWMVQIVHYPLMERVGRAEFHQYEIDHQRLISRVVIPLMIAEIATAILLIWFRPEGIGSTAVWVGVLLVTSIWLVTFMVQVPQHAALTDSYDPTVLRRLVNGNWYRTLAWTGRGLLVLWMIAQLIKR
jgi:uncharacterized membrane protein